MRKIFTIGETVLDILFKNNEPLTAKAGGSCLNSSVTLGRLGLPVHFIGQYGIDEVGNFIETFLKNNNVSTEYVYRYHDGKSSLALAFLNENNDASYDFYRIPPSKQLDIDPPDIWPDDIVLFGSFFSLNTHVRESLLSILKLAKKRKAIIIYDPNFRKPHLHNLRQLFPLIEENIHYSDIVRGSNEDFSLIFGSNNVKECFEALKDKSKILLHTANKNGVTLKTKNLEDKYSVDKITPKSTIGAGDNFNAGIIYSLINKDISLKQLQSLKTDEWKNIIEIAIKFASHVCLSYDNYISEEFAEQYRESLKL